MYNDAYYNDDKDMAAARQHLASDCQQRTTLHGHPPYVLKTLRQDLNPDEHSKGVTDLATEAEFLATVCHDNILPLRAVAAGNVHASSFFVILDRLSVTLDRKFNVWRKVVGQNAGVYLPLVGYYCCAKTVALTALWKERMFVMQQVAAALTYLHARGIMYRDLKPDNIGFDDADCVKIFDFGLAKRWKLAQVADDDDDDGDHHNNTKALNYHLTGQTGSLRYMAPEVALEMPYNESCDVYSWGILFWQVCALQTPFANYSTRAHAERVVHGGQRPTPDSSWPRPWRELQSACWQKIAPLRPTMKQVLEKVTAFGQALKESDDDDDDYYYGTTDLEPGSGSSMMEANGVSSLALQESTAVVVASKIKAKKKKKATADDALDADTRLGHHNNTHGGAPVAPFVKEGSNLV